MPGTRQAAVRQRDMVNGYDPVTGADQQAAPADMGLLARVSTPREISVGDTAQTFSFELDGELTKLVSLIPLTSMLRIIVDYATDVVIQHDSYDLPASKTVSVTADSKGVMIRWQARLMPPLHWPMIARQRRF